MSQTDHLFMPEDHMDEVYTSKNPLVKFVHNNRLDRVAESIPQKDGLKILDAGCGEGHLLERLTKKNSSHQYHGIDITDIALKRAKERCPSANISKMDLSDIGFEDETFDVITCSEVLEHIPEYPEVIEELKRILKKDGQLIITFPNEPLWTFSRFLIGRNPAKIPDHVNSFTPKMMKNAVNLHVENSINLPFRLPFFASLVSLIRFRK